MKLALLMLLVNTGIVEMEPYVVSVPPHPLTHVNSGPDKAALQKTADETAKKIEGMSHVKVKCMGVYQSTSLNTMAVGMYRDARGHGAAISFKWDGMHWVAFDLLTSVEEK